MTFALIRRAAPDRPRETAWLTLRGKGVLLACLVLLALIVAGCGGTRVSSDADLAVEQVADMAALDAAAQADAPPADLSSHAGHADLATPPDLTLCSGFGEACGCCDQSTAAAAGFYGLWCDPTSHTCQGCGSKPGDHCCDRPESLGLGRCKTSGTVLSCRSDSCYLCGNLGEATCTAAPACNSPWTPMQGQCM
jgi:hypothetical protein